MRTVHAGLLLALLASACSPLLGPDRPELSISLNSEAALPTSSVFQVVVGGRAHDLVLGPEGGSTRVRAPRTGELDVTVRLLDPTGTAWAEASFTQRFQVSHLHWISAHVGEHRPVGHCIGTLIALPLSLPRSGSDVDSAFVMYGSIPRGAIC